MARQLTEMSDLELKEEYTARHEAWLKAAYESKELVEARAELEKVRRERMRRGEQIAVPARIVPSAAVSRLLWLARRILSHARPGSGRRHEYANGRGTLSGCSLDEKEIQEAWEAVKAVDLDLPPLVIDRVQRETAEPKPT